MSGIVMEDKMVRFIYKMAFRDATIRRAFAKRRSESYDDFAIRKREMYNKAFEYVKEYIDLIISNNHPDPMVAIKEICDEKQGFSFGNAQKLVNMSAKYLYLSTYGDSKKRMLFTKCHCPMDGIIIDIIKNKNANYIYNNISWSTMELVEGDAPKEYVLFQKCIEDLCREEKLIPVEFDYAYWE